MKPKKTAFANPVIGEALPKGTKVVKGKNGIVKIVPKKGACK